MGTLILQLATVFAPIVADIIKVYHGKTGRFPTDAEIAAELTTNIDKALGAGAAWRATHPKENV